MTCVIGNLTFRAYTPTHLQPTKTTSHHVPHSILLFELHVREITYRGDVTYLYFISTSTARVTTRLDIRIARVHREIYPPACLHTTMSFQLGCLEHGLRWEHREEHTRAFATMSQVQGDQRQDNTRRNTAGATANAKSAQLPRTAKATKSRNTDPDAEDINKTRLYATHHTAVTNESKADQKNLFKATLRMTREGDQIMFVGINPRHHDPPSCTPTSPRIERGMLWYRRFVSRHLTSPRVHLLKKTKTISHEFVKKPVDPQTPAKQDTLIIKTFDNR